MKRWSPLITLLSGAVLGIALWIASMVAASPAPGGSGYGAAGSLPVSATPAATATSASVPSSAASTVPGSTAPAASPTATAGELEHANFVGMVSGGGAAIAISVLHGRAIAYFCNGKTMDAWLSGKMANGKLLLTGKRGAHAEVNVSAGHAQGMVMVNGTPHAFSVTTANRPAGLFRATAVVNGTPVKAGWIVLASGAKIGSLEVNPNSTAPVTQAAPPLDLATLTAVDDGVTITATPIDANTGSGF